MRDNLSSMICPSNIEKKFCEDTVENCETLDEYKDFCIKNAEAIAYIVHRLSTRVLLRVRSSVTAFEMHSRIITLYHVVSDVGKDAARSALFTLKCIKGMNLAKYIEKFEKCADRF